MTWRNKAGSAARSDAAEREGEGVGTKGCESRQGEAPSPQLLGRLAPFFRQGTFTHELVAESTDDPLDATFQGSIVLNSTDTTEKVGYSVAATVLHAEHVVAACVERRATNRVGVRRTASKPHLICSAAGR